MDVTSDAQYSKLWVLSGSTYSPALNGGPSAVQNYGASNFSLTTGGGVYVCSGIPNNHLLSPPDSRDYSGDVLGYYIAQTAMYRFLNFNDSVLSNNVDMNAFYAGLAGSSIDNFMQVEAYLYNNNVSAATGLLSGINTSGFNTVETNYKNYYTLHINYLNLDSTDTYTSADSSALYSLAQLCPGENGACVFQARALYNRIYNDISLYSDCSGDLGARVANNSSQAASNSINRKLWDVDLFPNPASEQLTIVSKQDNETLHISIKDLSGRQIKTADVKTSAFIANLDLALINGAYFITIVNSANERVTKKLLIAR